VGLFDRFFEVLRVDRVLFVGGEFLERVHGGELGLGTVKLLGKGDWFFPLLLLLGEALADGPAEVVDEGLGAPVLQLRLAVLLPDGFRRAVGSCEWAAIALFRLWHPVIPKLPECDCSRGVRGVFRLFLNDLQRFPLRVPRILDANAPVAEFRPAFEESDLCNQQLYLLVLLDNEFGLTRELLFVVLDCSLHHFLELDDFALHRLLHCSTFLHLALEEVLLAQLAVEQVPRLPRPLAHQRTSAAPEALELLD
jgi:hypothetical protein